MQSSGAITLAQIQAEFGGSNPIAMSEYYRGGAYVTNNNISVPTNGTISVSNFYGTTFRPQLTYTIAANIEFAVINPTTLPGYIAGKSDITIVVNPGIYVYNTVVWNPSMRILAANSGDTIRLVNYGYIMGCGGHVWPHPTSSYYGGNAIDIYFPVTIDNTSVNAYIGGGGGGGASSNYEGAPSGGGGAGGGTVNAMGGGSAGGLGGVGGNGSVYTFIDGDGYERWGAGGGGGGRIFPGAGGAGGTNAGYPFSDMYGKGGGAGGGGGRIPAGGNGGSGGSGNAAGGSAGTYAAGGGGGWGAAGGTAYPTTGAFAGGAGGKAVALNGNSVVWVSGDTSRVYGSVS